MKVFAEPKNRRAVAVAGALAALVAAVAFGRPSRPPPSSLAWPAGHEQIYALSWSTTTETTAITSPFAAGEPESAVKTQVDVQGELVLSSFGARGSDTILLARFDHLRLAEVRALDQPLLPSPDAAKKELEGRAAELVVTPRGEVSDVHFRASDPALFRYLMQAALTELAVDLRDATAWTADVDGPAGRGPVHFARDADKPLVVRRTRERYDTLSAWPLGSLPQRLDSKGVLVLEPSGVLGELHDDEKLEAARPGSSRDVLAKTTFSLVHEGERPFDASKPPEGFDQPMLAAPAAGEDETARRARLERRTEGMTLARVIDDIRIHAAVPKGKSGRWAWEAQGYLELHPEKTEELVDAMRGWDRPSKAYAIDLLIMTGHDPAQAALCRAFRDGTIAPGVEWAILVQRFAQVQRPNATTASYVSSAYASAKARKDAPAARAAAVALGGIVHHLSTTDRALARTLDDPLVLDLYAANDPHDREMLLLAVGNASLEEDALAIRLRAHDEAPAVRAAAATALRRLDSREIRATLLEMLFDPSADVQAQALASLDRRDPTPDELARVRDAVGTGKFRALNAEALLNFVAKRRHAGPEIDGILDALGARQDLDAQTAGRIERIRTGGA